MQRRRCRPVLAESTVTQMVDSLLGEEAKKCDKDCDCKKCKMEKQMKGKGNTKRKSRAALKRSQSGRGARANESNKY